MLEQKVLKDQKDKMGKVIEHFQSELSSVRSNRASPQLVENIVLDYYGTPTKLRELAGITAPEPRMLLIQPWDPAMVEAVEKTLSKNEFGFVPRVEGKLIRIIVPELSEERREELKKTVKNMAEETRVSLRNIRRDLNEVVKKGQKDGELTEDEKFRIEKEVQVKTDEFIKKIDEIVARKDKELMQI